MLFREMIVGLVFLLLFVWGPIDKSTPLWLWIRLGELIGVPLIMWFLLKWIWEKWQPSEKINNLSERDLACVVCGGLLVMAIFEATSGTHLENTQWIRTREGMEAVGDDVIVKGPSWGNVTMLSIAAVGFFWFGVLRKSDQKDS